ncbi:MAG: aminoglycoside phosphotransferase family protein [archaeon]
MNITDKEIELYLKDKFGKDAKLNEFKELGKGVYGTAYLVDFDAGKENQRLVLKTMGLGGFGHDFKADVAANLILANDTFNKLDKHIKSYDVAAFDGKELISIGDAKEYYILMEEARGKEYNDDFEKMLKGGITEKDKKRTKQLAKYLAEIHREKKPDQALCTRRARDLVGHGEYIMGVLDGYAKDSFLSADEKVEIVKLCVDWWQTLQGYAHRFCVVHGDFHPYNIMFDKDEFIVLDRSRGELGEPGEDVAAMAINYLRLEFIKKDGSFKELFDLFMNTYIEETGDTELLKVIQPFFAFRAIVVANPIFYPDEWIKERGAEPEEYRKSLIDFTKKILKTEEVKLEKILKW